MKREGRNRARRLALGIVAAALAGYLLFPAVRTAFHSACMAFTQRSVHVLIGRISSAACRWAEALGLAIFQCLVLPFFEPLLTVADRAVFGGVWGTLLAAGGDLLGGLGCYGLARALLGDHLPPRLLPQRAYEKARRCGALGLLGLCCCLPRYYGIFCYCAGILGVRTGAFLLAAALARVPTVIAYSLLTSVYTTLLPDGGRLALAGYGAVCCAVWLWLSRRRARTHTDSVGAV